MGSAATKAKRKWNREHYTNVTVALNPVLAAELKADCRGKGVSVSSVIDGLVAQYLSTEVTSSGEKPKPKTPDNRGQRRKALLKHIAAIEHICEGEEAYLQAIPENMRAGVRCENAENSVEHLLNAIDELREVYP